MIELWLLSAYPLSFASFSLIRNAEVEHKADCNNVNDPICQVAQAEVSLFHSVQLGYLNDDVDDCEEYHQNLQDMFSEVISLATLCIKLEMVVFVWEGLAV